MAADGAELLRAPAAHRAAPAAHRPQNDRSDGKSPDVRCNGHHLRRHRRRSAALSERRRPGTERREAGRVGALCLRLPSGDHVEVAKWQTHQLEGLAPFRAWGFKSPLRHQYLAVFPQVRDLRRVWITRLAGRSAAQTWSSRRYSRRAFSSAPERHSGERVTPLHFGRLSSTRRRAADWRSVCQDPAVGDGDTH